MKGFLQVLSLFGLPVAIIIWHDLYTHSGAYLQNYSSEASRYVALGIYVVTAILCLHLPLRLWRRFDAAGLKLFCLTASLVTFWVAVRSASSGRLGETALMKSALVFLIPLLMYALLRRFLFQWARAELSGAATGGDDDLPTSGKIPTSSKDSHGDS